MLSFQKRCECEKEVLNHDSRENVDHEQFLVEVKNQTLKTG